MTKQSSGSLKTDIKADGDVSRDLEIGAAESETESLLAHEGAS